MMARTTWVDLLLTTLMLFLGMEDTNSRTRTDDNSYHEEGEASFLFLNGSFGGSRLQQQLFSQGVDMTDGRDTNNRMLLTASIFENPLRQCCVAWIFETRTDNLVFDVVENIHQNIPSDWSIIIQTLPEHVDTFNASESVKAISSDKRNIRVSPLQLRKDAEFSSYNDLLMTAEFWRQFQEYESVLVFQRDTVFCGARKNNTIEDFLEYDYVGAPWNYKGGTTFMQVAVGNGGFSLRKVQAMLRVLRECRQSRRRIAEDMFFARCLTQKGHLPPPEVAGRFAMERIGSEDFLALHQSTRFYYENLKSNSRGRAPLAPWPWRGRTPCEVEAQMLQACPPFALLIPMLHAALSPEEAHVLDNPPRLRPPVKCSAAAAAAALVPADQAAVVAAESPLPRGRRRPQKRETPVQAGGLSGQQVGGGGGGGGGRGQEDPLPGALAAFRASAGGRGHMPLPAAARLPLGPHPPPPPPPGRRRERALVVYAGPTAAGCEGKNGLYHRNFQYFLHQGLPCSHAGTAGTMPPLLSVDFDFALVLTRSSYAVYEQQLKEVTAVCQSVRVVLREDRCYDLEAGRVVLATLNITSYDYYVHVNCGLVGPLSASGRTSVAEEPFWPMQFLQPLQEKGRTHLVGLTFNCAIHPHVQSFLYATDREGLATILKAGCVFDCGTTLAHRGGRMSLVRRYEVGMSRAVVAAGGELATANTTNGWQNYRFSSETITQERPPGCSDFWFRKDYPKNSLEAPEGLAFWKVTSNMPDFPGLEKQLIAAEAQHKEMTSLLPPGHHVPTEICYYRY